MGAGDGGGDGSGDGGGDGDVSGTTADSGRSLGAAAGLVLWWMVLTGVVLGATGVVTAQGTVLSAGFVTDELAAQGTYGALEDTVEDELLDRRVDAFLGGAETGVVPGAERVVATTVREAITEAYVRDTTTRNVRALYAYLHGEGPLELGIDTRPLTENVDTVVAERIRGFPVTQLLTGSSFAAAFSGIDGVTVEDVAAAYENRTRYRALQTRVRGVYEARGLDRDQLNRSLRAQTPVDGLPQSVREPVYRLEGTTVLALTSDMPHAEFVARMDRARDDLAVAFVGFAQREVAAALPARVNLTAELRAQDRRRLATAADGVQLLDILALVLPAAAVVLVVALLAVTRSVRTTALTAGTSLLMVGGLSVLAAALLRPQVETALHEGVSEPVLRSAATGLADGTLAALGSRGLLLAVAGGVCLLVRVLVGRVGLVPERWW